MIVFLKSKEFSSGPVTKAPAFIFRAGVKIDKKRLVLCKCGYLGSQSSATSGFCKLYAVCPHQNLHYKKSFLVFGEVLSDLIRIQFQPS